MEDKHFIQEVIAESSAQLTRTWNIYEAQKIELKNMENNLKRKLNDNFQFNQVTNQETILKQNIQDLKEQLRILKQEKEEVSRTFDDFQEIEDFKIKMDMDFFQNKNKWIEFIQYKLMKKWLNAQVFFNKWKINLKF